MSKAKEIWSGTIGSVHGADVTQELCFKAAVQLAAYASELEKEQSDLDWLEVKVTELHEEIRKEPEYTIYPPCFRVLALIKERREAKS